MKLVFKTKDEELEYYRAQKKTQMERAERLRIKNTLFVQKAKAAGLTVTEAEVDEYLKNMNKKG